MEAKPIKYRQEIAPTPLILKQSSPPLLACGGDLKNVFSFAQRNSFFQGPLVGDLESAGVFRVFRESIEHYKKTLEIEPEIVVVDKHPGYFSSRYGRDLGLPVIEVQHHHAHVAAVMAEYGLSGEVIGLALDGTGYGDDGTIWGGEILLASYSKFSRVGYLKPLHLPGGNAAAREPWRTAAGLLFRIFGENMYAAHPGFVKRIGLKRIQPMVSMIETGFNCPLSSGAGRLFDAAASLLDVRDYNTFEAEAPIALEKMADVSEDGIFEYYIEESGEIDFDPMIKQLVQWPLAKKDISVACAKFHNTIAAALAQACHKLRREYGLNRVCLGGGVFQNKFLLKRLIRLLESDDFQVFLPEKFSVNDSGLSLGQTAIAIALGG